MGLDIRLPIGLMFTFIGALLSIYGALYRSNSLTHAGGSEVNINLIWGVVLLVFGVLMLFGALGGRKNPPGK